MKQKTLKRYIKAWILMGLLTVETLAVSAADVSIIPDRQVPAAQQPLVQQTANGIPLVQITAPTAGGVSRNAYEQFNVSQKGAVLNNSYMVSPTKLAGYVQGNPNMVRGSAKVIVNEVTSNRPTQINGFLEVAGPKASVVVANPNGITVNGGGFINTSQAMLTTGRPMYDAGRLSGLHVTDGMVKVEGRGLDASQTDRVAILARAVALNAGIWAQDAHVITGANDVSYTDLQVSAIAGAGKKPSVALDVAAIGGMYANRMYLVGTEKGLGVNVTGTLSAVKSLVLEHNGDLHIRRNTQGSSAVYSEGTMSVHTTGSIRNDQTLASGGDAVIHAEKGLTNTAVIGSGISRDGKVNQPGSLQLQTTTLTNDSAQIVSGGAMQIQAEEITTKAGEISAQGQADLKVTNTLHMDTGKITARKNLSITADTLPLHGLLASDGDTVITTRQDLTNQYSKDTFGDIKAGGTITLRTDGSLYNVKTFESGSNLNIQAAQNADNTGLITANGKTAIQAGYIHNHLTGRIYGDDIALSAASIENRKHAGLEAQLEKEIKKLQDKEKALDAAYMVDVTAYTRGAQEQAYKRNIEEKTKDYDTQLAVVAKLKKQMAAYTSPVIAARRTLEITGTDAILNRAGAMMYSGGIMTLQAGKTVINQGAKMESVGNLSMKAPQITNLNDSFSAKRIGSAWITNPEKIRIDEAGHPERGQVFNKNEFDNFDSGYGAHHRNSAASSYPIDDLTVIRTHSQTSEKQVQTTHAGVIRSGGHMTIDGSLHNDNSQIAAGQTLTVRNGTVTNTATENQKLTVTFGTTQASYTERHSRFHKGKIRKYKGRVFMTPQVEKSNPIPLGIAVYQENTQTRPDSKDITKTIRGHAQKFLDPFSIDSSGTNATPAQWKQTASGLSSSLYKLHPEMTAKYLIETDSAFTNKHKFLSSDYMYEQMKWHPEKVAKRLGDGFYEQSLIREQILSQTGRRYLEGDEDDVAAYKALMDAGVVYAKKTGLVPGVSLSAEQVAGLTSDIVWLEIKTVWVNGQPQDVVYPRVYLRASSNMALQADGSLLSANQMVIQTKQALQNEGILQGKTIRIQAGFINHTGRMLGQDVSLASDTDIQQDGLLTATDRVELKAGRHIAMQASADHLTHQDVLNRTAGIAVTGNHGVLIASAGKDIHLAGAALEALGDKGTVILQAGGDVNLTAQTLAAKKDMTQDGDNYLRTYRQTEIGTAVDAKGGIAIQAGQDIHARAAYLNSDQGTVALTAGRDITLTAGREVTADDYGLKHTASGLLSSTTTTVRTHDQHEGVLGTVMTGEQLQMKANRDTDITAGTLVGQDSTSLSSGRHLRTTSGTQRDETDIYQHVSTSGMMGAGLGMMIGTQKTTDTYQGDFVTQKGTTIASTKGNVRLIAGDTAHLTTTYVLGKDGIDVTGQQIRLDGKTNAVHERQTHEESSSGLTIGLSGPGLHAVKEFRGVVRTAQTRQNKTLQGLELFEGGRELKSSLQRMGTQGAKTIGLHVGIGSQSFKQEHEMDAKTYAGGTLSGGTVKLTADSEQADKGMIHATGETIQGKHITLSAAKNILLDAGKNTQTEKQTYSSQRASVGASFHGGLTGIDASFGAANSTGATTKTSHTGTDAAASHTLTAVSGKDTQLLGSQLSGHTVHLTVGSKLHVESKQDTETYTESNSQAGFSISTGVMNGRLGSTTTQAGLGIGAIDSQYASVINQAGIYAGQGGYTVNVANNTCLQGAVIDSTAAESKNKLTTGMLTMETIENKAEYTVKGGGLSYAHYGDKKTQQEKANTTGLLPSLTPGSKNNASSITTSAVSPGTITTTKETTDISNINRDTRNALNTLANTFDKQKIEERQKLSQLFLKNADMLLHHYNRDGKIDKAVAHGLAAEFAASLAGNSAGSGFYAGFINELLVNKTAEWAGKDPVKAQWLSAAIGAGVNAVIGGNAQTGAIAAQYGMQWNNMYDNDITEGEFKNQNDAYYAMYANCEVELENTAFNDASDTMRMLAAESNLQKIFDVASLAMQHSNYQYVAASLFQDALHGNGESRYYPLGTAASNLLQEQKTFFDKVHELGEFISPGATKYFYTSISCKGDALLAFGHIKMALAITNNGNGTFSVEGQARDVYNFERLGYQYPKTEIKEIIKRNSISAMNDAAYFLQKTGNLYPYIYAIQIKTTI